jgi:hypothetical protein
MGVDRSVVPLRMFMAYNRNHIIPKPSLNIERSVRIQNNHPKRFW